jgi:hypothetical protein
MGSTFCDTTYEAIIPARFHKHPEVISFLEKLNGPFLESDMPSPVELDSYGDMHFKLLSHGYDGSPNTSWYIEEQYPDFNDICIELDHLVEANLVCLMHVKTSVWNTGGDYDDGESSSMRSDYCSVDDPDALCDKIPTLILQEVLRKRLAEA